MSAKVAPGTGRRSCDVSRETSTSGLECSRLFSASSFDGDERRALGLCESASAAAVVPDSDEDSSFRPEGVVDEECADEPFLLPCVACSSSDEETDEASFPSIPRSFAFALFASERAALDDLADFRAFDVLDDLGMSKSFAEPPRARARAPEGRPGKRTSRGSAANPEAATEPSSLVTCEGINAPRPLPKAACFVAALPEPARLLFSFTIMTSINLVPLFHVKQSRGIPRRRPVHDRCQMFAVGSRSGSECSSIAPLKSSS